MRPWLGLAAALAVAAACSEDPPETDAAAGSGGGPAGGGAPGEGGHAQAEDCNGNPLDVDLGVVRACVMQAGCNPFLPSVSLSFCVTNQRLRTFPQGDCGTDATSCADFLECLGVGYYDGDGCESGEAAYCEGDGLAVTCARYAYAIDCAAQDAECGTYRDADGDLTARCFHAELDGCTDPEGETRCDGDIAYSCVDGVGYGTDCAASDSVCREGSCYYSLPECSAPGARCSASTRLDVCYEERELASYECAPGLRCSQPSGAPVACVAPGCATDEDCEESCDGSELTLCYGGVPFTLDCADYGFATCLETRSGDRQLAHCARPVSARDRACDVLETDNDCAACAKTECCAAWRVCLDEPQCLAYLGCATECEGESDCVADCAESSPRGATLFTAFSDCREASCEC